MRYMLLIYKDESAPHAPELTQRSVQAVWDVIDEARRAGIFCAAEPLAPTSSATTVRAQREGVYLVTDGPFAETKEQLAGYYIVDCANLDEALEIARKIPICGGGQGCIEIRPLVALPERVPASAAGA